MFTTRFASLTKQTEIFNGVDPIILEEVRVEEDDDCMVFEKPTQRIEQLALMARSKGRDEKAKVRFLTRVVGGTRWELSGIQRTPNEPSK